MKSIKIKDTTREERYEIIQMSLGDGDGDCESIASGVAGGGDPMKIYQPYIDGEKEIAQINMEYHAKYIK